MYCVRKLPAIVALGLGLAAGTPAFADQVTVGVSDTGNCYPFMCNDTGVTSGQSIDYQQVYASSAFGANPTTITSISFSVWPVFTWGSTSTLNGTYDIYLGYSANPVNGLSTNLASNVVSEMLVATYTGGGSGTFTISLTTPFAYNPGLGNLLMEVVAFNQDNVPNGSTNGYNNDDNTGRSTSRAYCFSNGGCFADSNGLVTQFGTTSVPEPGSLALLVAGLAGFGAFRLRRKPAA